MSTSIGERAHEVASAFIRLQPYFKSYATYSANYPYVAGALAKAREAHPRVHTFLANAELMHSVSLSALLFRPVQRMCVYPLLFQRGLKQAPKEHALHGSLQRAFVLSQQTVSEINEQVRVR